MTLILGKNDDSHVTDFQEEKPSLSKEMWSKKRKKRRRKGYLRDGSVPIIILKGFQAVSNWKVLNMQLMRLPLKKFPEY